MRSTDLAIVQRGGCDPSGLFPESRWTFFTWTRFTLGPFCETEIMRDQWDCAWRGTRKVTRETASKFWHAFFFCHGADDIKGKKFPGDQRKLKEDRRRNTLHIDHTVGEKREEEREGTTWRQAGIHEESISLKYYLARRKICECTLEGWRQRHSILKIAARFDFTRIARLTRLHITLRTGAVGICAKTGWRRTRRRCWVRGVTFSDMGDVLRNGVGT